MPTKTKSPSMADRTEAKLRGASAQMERAKSLAAQAEKLAASAILDAARAVVRMGPIASEYVQAMGSWFFTVCVPYADQEENGDFYDHDVTARGSELESFERSIPDFAPEYREPARAFLDAVKKLRELHDGYLTMFGERAAGSPARMKATGDIVRDW